MNEKRTKKREKTNEMHSQRDEWSTKWDKLK